MFGLLLDPAILVPTMQHGSAAVLTPNEIQELTDDTLKRDKYVHTYTDVLAPRLREIGSISRKLMHLATPDIKLAQHQLGKLLGMGLGMPIETFCSQNLRWFYYHQVAFCDSWEVILGQWASGNTSVLRPTVPDTTHMSWVINSIYTLDIGTVYRISANAYKRSEC